MISQRRLNCTSTKPQSSFALMRCCKAVEKAILDLRSLSWHGAYLSILTKSTCCGNSSFILLSLSQCHFFLSHCPEYPVPCCRIFSSLRSLSMELWIGLWGCDDSWRPGALLVLGLRLLAAGLYVLAWDSEEGRNFRWASRTSETRLPWVFCLPNFFEAILPAWHLANEKFSMLLAWSETIWRDTFGFRPSVQGQPQFKIYFNPCWSHTVGIELRGILVSTQDNLRWLLEAPNFQLGWPLNTLNLECCLLLMQNF